MKTEAQEVERKKVKHMRDEKREKEKDVFLVNCTGHGDKGKGLSAKASSIIL